MLKELTTADGLKIRGNIGVLDQVFFTDEAWFHLNGYVNS